MDHDKTESIDAILVGMTNAAKHYKTEISHLEAEIYLLQASLKLREQIIDNLNERLNKALGELNGLK